MKPVVDPAKHTTGILMGAETQDSHKKPYMVVPDISVYDPSLIPVVRLGFMVRLDLRSTIKPQPKLKRMAFLLRTFLSMAVQTQRPMARQ